MKCTTKSEIWVFNLWGFDSLTEDKTVTFIFESAIAVLSVLQGVPKKMPHSELRLLGAYRDPLKQHFSQLSLRIRKGT